MKNALARVRMLNISAQAKTKSRFPGDLQPEKRQ
jgi:hypothetical protein